MFTTTGTAVELGTAEIYDWPIPLGQYKMEGPTFSHPMPTNRFECPCCGTPTLEERGAHEICEECGWEDDGQDDDDNDPEDIWGGPNGDISLAQARRNYIKYGSIDSGRDS